SGFRLCGRSGVITSAALDLIAICASLLFRLCDFSHLVGPNYGARTKIALSDVIKHILLENNENLALCFVTAVHKSVTLRRCNHPKPVAASRWRGRVQCVWTARK